MYRAGRASDPMCNHFGRREGILDATVGSELRRRLKPSGIKFVSQKAFGGGLRLINSVFQQNI